MLGKYLTLKYIYVESVIIKEEFERSKVKKSGDDISPSFFVVDGFSNSGTF